MTSRKFLFHKSSIEDIRAAMLLIGWASVRSRSTHGRRSFRSRI